MPLSVDDVFRLRDRHPVIDVRSEGEFAHGHIPGAFNVPLLNNEERAIVGTTYKLQGREEAVKDGFRLVGPRLNEIVEKAKDIAQGRQVLVHCWRGGMRSSNFAAFISMAGVRSEVLAGGYKAYRHEVLESFTRPVKMNILGGYTGSGKSEILRRLKDRGQQVLDLEKMANHRGSAFGGFNMDPQPTSEQFQNNLFEEIRTIDRNRPVWVEDESLAIGRIFLPDEFWKQMRSSPLYELDVVRTVRVTRLAAEYGATDRDAFSQTMQKISKRLGGQNLKAAQERLAAGDLASAIDILLNYYDRTYREGIEKRQRLIKARVQWDGLSVDAAAGELIARAEKMVGQAV